MVANPARDAARAYKLECKARMARSEYELCAADAGIPIEHGIIGDAQIRLTAGRGWLLPAVHCLRAADIVAFLDGDAMVACLPFRLVCKWLATAKSLPTVGHGAPSKLKGLARRVPQAASNVGLRTSGSGSSVVVASHRVTIIEKPAVAVLLDGCDIVGSEVVNRSEPLCLVEWRRLVRLMAAAGETERPSTTGHPWLVVHLPKESPHWQVRSRKNLLQCQKAGLRVPDVHWPCDTAAEARAKAAELEAAHVSPRDYEKHGPKQPKEKPRYHRKPCMCCGQIPKGGIEVPFRLCSNCRAKGGGEYQSYLEESTHNALVTGQSTKRRPKS